MLVHVGEQNRFRNCQAVGISGQRDGAVELKMGQSADVIKIERVGRVIGSDDIGVCPLRCERQVVHGIGVRKAAGQIRGTLQGKIKFGGA